MKNRQRKEKRQRLQRRVWALSEQGQANFKDNAKVLRIPLHWTPAQATAVYEVLDELLDIVLRSYSLQIQQTLKFERTTQGQYFNCADIPEQEVPF
jgi:endonuclease/exonuclease/phosphatase (EEP) superfamily protein YafD